MMEQLLNTIPQIGSIDWIGIRKVKRGALEALEEVIVTVENGLTGDHYQGRSKKRQVTLIQAEHLDAVASIMKRTVYPELTRRNIVVRGINLLALKDKQFLIGESVVLEYTGACHPCSRMETNLGPGGYNAMRGHGGITAKVIKGGKIRKGDNLQWINNEVIK